MAGDNDVPARTGSVKLIQEGGAHSDAQPRSTQVGPRRPPGGATTRLRPVSVAISRAVGLGPYGDIAPAGGMAGRPPSRTAPFLLLKSADPVGVCEGLLRWSRPSVVSTSSYPSSSQSSPRPLRRPPFVFLGPPQARHPIESKIEQRRSGIEGKPLPFDPFPAGGGGPGGDPRGGPGGGRHPDTHPPRGALGPRKAPRRGKSAPRRPQDGP